MQAHNDFQLEESRDAERAALSRWSHRYDRGAWARYQDEAC